MQPTHNATQNQQQHSGCQLTEWLLCCQLDDQQTRGAWWLYQKGRTQHVLFSSLFMHTHGHWHQLPSWLTTATSLAAQRVCCHLDFTCDFSYISHCRMPSPRFCMSFCLFVTWYFEPSQPLRAIFLTYNLWIVTDPMWVTYTSQPYFWSLILNLPWPSSLYKVWANTHSNLAFDLKTRPDLSHYNKNGPLLISIRTKGLPYSTGRSHFVTQW